MNALVTIVIIIIIIIIIIIRHRTKTTRINLIILNNFYLFVSNCKLNRKNCHGNTKWPRFSLYYYMYILRIKKNFDELRKIRYKLICRKCVWTL
jgi:hypothetical protein